MSMNRIHLSPPHVGELERRLLLEAFDANWIAPVGPAIQAFEQECAERIGVPHAVALASGTAALHLALMILDVGQDDEVIAPTLTFAATANVIAYQRAQPVFVDCSREQWTLDPELLKEELAAGAKRGRLPKAVITVDLYGQCADYDAIDDACAPYGIPVIEDAAEALGATYKGRPAGSFGLLAAFSFNGNKIITTGGGGMLLSRCGDFIDRARYLSTQARDPAPHYEHSTIGYNYRLSNLLAAVGLGQLHHLDDRVRQRQANAAFYRAALGGVPGISFMPEPSFQKGNGWLTCITIDEERFGATRDDVRLRLEAGNIEARPVWKPMHLQPVFQGCRSVGGGVAQNLFEAGLCLPSGSSLTPADRERIVDQILSARVEARPRQPILARRNTAPNAFTAEREKPGTPAPTIPTGPSVPGPAEIL
jgi:dTDP-4-amino-4,6-dideoxygalactose transaminase